MNFLDEIHQVTSIQNESDYRPLFIATFAIKKTLVRANGRLYGSMAQSPTYVCTPGFAVHSFLEESAIINITDFKPCSHGDAVVLIEHY